MSEVTKMTRKLFSGLFFLLGCGICALGILICLGSRNTQPILLETPQAAVSQIESMMNAACRGDFDAVSGFLYGSPRLTATPEDETASALWGAYIQNLSYTLSGELYASDTGLAQDVTITMLDVSSVTEHQHSRTQALIDDAAADGHRAEEIYDGTNGYRQEFVMTVYRQALTDALREDAQFREETVTLHLVYEDSQWWIQPDAGLIRCLSGGIGV